MSTPQKSQSQLRETLAAVRPGLRRQVLTLELARRLGRNPLRWVQRADNGAITPFAWFARQREAFAAWSGDRLGQLAGPYWPEGWKPQRKIFGFLGGNRLGKTEWAARVIGCYALGVNPLGLAELEEDPAGWRLGPARLIWCVNVTGEKARDAQQRALWRIIPRQFWRTSFSEQNGFHNNVGVLSNGSRLIFKSEEQDVRTFESDAVDAVWVDENVSWPYVLAAFVRLTDRAGWLVWTSWPNSPVFRDLFLERSMRPGQGQSLAAADVAAVFGSMADNPLISSAEIALRASLMDPAERMGRIQGKLAVSEELVYGAFDRRVHLEEIRWPIPPDWTLDETIDPGWDNPCAVLFRGLDRFGVRHYYDEIYRTRRTVGQIACEIYLRRWLHRGLLTPAEEREFRGLFEPPEDVAAPPVQAQMDQDRRLHDAIRTWRRRKGDCAPRTTAIDCAGEQRDQGKPVSTVQQFAAYGIHCLPVANRARREQRARVRELLQPIAGRVQLRVGGDCAMTAWEFEHHRRRKPDEALNEYLGDREDVVDGNNHALSAIEYLESLGLTWRPTAEERGDATEPTATRTGGWRRNG